MKRLIVILFILISNIGLAQKNLYYKYETEYESPYKLFIREYNNTYDVYINCIPHDNKFTEGYFVINKQKLPKVIKEIEQARNKYVDWRNIAINDNTTDILIKISLRTNLISTMFVYNEQNLTSINNRFTYHFSVDKLLKTDTRYLLIVSVLHIIPKENTFLINDGMSIIFNNEQEINNLLYLLNPDRIEEYIEKNMGYSL